MRVGVFGGSFDPVHFGHLLLAERCREACKLDEVRFVPARHPPHKDPATVSSGPARAEMLELALAGYPEFIVDRRELSREGPSYTVDTLAELKQEDDSRLLFLLMGGDSLVDLPTWREPLRIVELATIVVANRGREPLPSIADVARHLGDASASRFETVGMPAVEFSATDIRRRVREARSIRFMTPRAVEVYIREHGLYAASSHDG